MSEDFANYDYANESETVVLESNYFSSYKGIPVIRIEGNRSGYFGAIFLTRETETRTHPEDVVRHEYGHAYQLQELGPVNYLICIGLPSWQKWGSDSYYDKPWEVVADIMGGVQSRNHSAEKIAAGYNYLSSSKKWGIFAWCTIK